LLSSFLPLPPNPKKEEAFFSFLSFLPLFILCNENLSTRISLQTFHAHFVHIVAKFGVLTRIRRHAHHDKTRTTQHNTTPHTSHDTKEL
jgi:hypothetical protein